MKYYYFQKKIILQTGNSGVSVIDVIPIDNSDSSNESPITVQVSPSDSPEENNGQQVTAQVAVVQAQSPSDNAHYITVTGELIHIII